MSEAIPSDHLLPAEGGSGGKTIIKSRSGKGGDLFRPEEVKPGRSLEDHQRIKASLEPKVDDRTADELKDENDVIEGVWVEEESEKKPDNFAEMATAAAAGVVTEELLDSFDSKKDPKRESPKFEPEEPKETRGKKEEEKTWAKIENKLSKIADKKINSRDGTIAPRLQDEADTLKDERDILWEGHKGDKRYKVWKQEISKEIELIINDDQEYRQRNILMPNSINRNDPLIEMLNWIDTKINRVVENTPEEQIATSWWKGVRRNIEEQALKSEQELREELGMPSAKQLGAAVRRLDIKIDFLNWGSNKDDTRATWEKLGDARKAWLIEEEPSYRQRLGDLKNQPVQPPNGQVDMFKGLFGSGHTLESYEKTGDTRGIFNDEPGHGLYQIFPNPIVIRKAETAMESSGTWDMFIELNKFAQGRGDIALWGKLLEYALPGEDNEGNRWGMVEMAKFMNAIYNISRSADYKKLIDKEKGLLNGVDPRAIAIIIKQVPEMSSAFAHYWEKFRDPNLITTPQDIITEADLRNEDTRKAAEWKCSEGIVRATRHWVTEFGVFPFTQSEIRKMVNRYPELFQNKGTLKPGIGFELVEIQGERGTNDSLIVQALQNKDYQRFLELYSDTSNLGNTDPVWSLKMWLGVDTVHDFIAQTYKAALKDLKENTPDILGFMGIDSSAFQALITQGLLTDKPITIPSLVDMVTSMKGTRALRPVDVKYFLKHILSLEPENDSMPTGPIRSIHHVFMFGDTKREIVQALMNCPLKKKQGLDGPVK
jgi:hypothetical protein